MFQCQVFSLAGPKGGGWLCFPGMASSFLFSLTRTSKTAASCINVINFVCAVSLLQFLKNSDFLLKSAFPCKQFAAACSVDPFPHLSKQTRWFPTSLTRGHCDNHLSVGSEPALKSTWNGPKPLPVVDSVRLSFTNLYFYVCIQSTCFKWLLSPR